MKPAWLYFKLLMRLKFVNFEPGEHYMCSDNPSQTFLPPVNLKYLKKHF